MRCVIATILLAAALVMAIALAGSFADNRIVADKIDTALRTGAVVFPSAYDRNSQTGMHTWADCNVLEIATFGRKDLISALTRAEYIPPQPGAAIGAGGHTCDHLIDKVRPSPAAQSPTDDYWRYWWASASLLNVALGFTSLGLSSYQLTLKSISYTTIALLGIAAFIRYRRAAWPFAPLLVALLLGFGLPLFGQSVADAPGLIVGMFLVLLYIAAGLDCLGERGQFLFAYTVGALTAAFELLNADIVATLLVFAWVRLVSLTILPPPRILLPAPSLSGTSCFR
jgi:hypothetical protein